MAILQVGRIVLTESELRNISESPSGTSYRTLTVEGIETSARESTQSVRRKQMDVVNSYGMMVPVTFQSKSDWDGYYAVSKSDATLTDWASENAAACEWEFELSLLGSYNDLDIESRLGGPLSLQNDHTGVGERWHAPAGGHSAYWSAGAQPPQVNRTGSEGPIKVYRGLELTTNPRWSCPANLYGVGRARFTDAEGFERTGQASLLTPTGWSLSNSLIRVTGLATGGTIAVESHDGTSWEAKNWDLRYNGADLGVPVGVSILRNDYELVQLRMLWNITPSGRVTADLSLRRGARFVEVYLKSMLGATLGLHPATGEAGSNSAGYITAAADDAAGNRYSAGSSKAYDADTTNGGLSKGATLSLDAYIGSVVGGGSAAEGDNADDIFAQFLGAPSERVIGVRI